MPQNFQIGNTLFILYVPIRKVLVPEKNYAEKQFIFGIHSKINANFKAITKQKVCLHGDVRDKNKL